MEFFCTSMHQFFISRAVYCTLHIIVALSKICILKFESLTSSIKKKSLVLVGIRKNSHSQYSILLFVPKFRVFFYLILSIVCRFSFLWRHLPSIDQCWFIFSIFCFSLSILWKNITNHRKIFTMIHQYFVCYNIQLNC